MRTNSIFIATRRRRSAADSAADGAGVADFPRVYPVAQCGTRTTASVTRTGEPNISVQRGRRHAA